MARATRAWLLWLALALVAAHSLAAWHAYTHSIAETASRSSDKQHAGADPCGLCIAVSGIGGAAAAQPMLHLHRFAQQAPLPMRSAARQQLPQRQPYAIRAPPVLAA
jgi:hypothetical protein